LGGKRAGVRFQESKTNSALGGALEEFDHPFPPSPSGLGSGFFNMLGNGVVDAAGQLKQVISDGSGSPYKRKHEFFGNDSANSKPLQKEANALRFAMGSSKAKVRGNKTAKGVSPASTKASMTPVSKAIAACTGSTAITQETLDSSQTCSDRTMSPLSPSNMGRPAGAAIELSSGSDEDLEVIEISASSSEDESPSPLR